MQSALAGEALVQLRWALNDSSNKIPDWDYHMVTPCFSWSHVTCTDGHVTSLSLSSSGLSGTFSPSITKLKHLVSLELQNNNLSGVLPDYLGDLTQLEYLNLANNGFTGPLPSKWGQLSKLRRLVISNNQLTGEIPDSIANNLGLKEVDFSSNNFTGTIPVRFFAVAKYNFTGNHLDCNFSSQQCFLSSPITTYSHSSNLGYRGFVIGGAGGGIILMLSIGVVFIYLNCKARALKHDVYFDVSGEDEHRIAFGQIKQFSWRELQLATGDFSENNVLGQGGFGKVYKGILSDNTKVAVKRLTAYHSPVGEAAFLREVELISVATHKNILRLIGFCITASERILVYPFMENLSVAHCLRDLKPGEKVLDWPSRKRIAQGTAHGMEYLHEYCNPKIIHRDLKAANILLDENYEAVVGDFGLAKLIDPNSTHVTTQVRGTMGHIAPEYLSTGRSSEKTDVFGYGITLLELVTGQRAIDLSRLEEEEDVLLLDHIKKLLREKRLADIVDNNLKENYDPKEVEIVVQVALLCTQRSPDDRPKMAEVVHMLQGVGLVERWEYLQQLEKIQNQEFPLVSQQFVWADVSSYDQTATELSKGR
ncbi:LRR receptor kinase SERK2-like isoform X2 [Nymphaea colorata]|uniref:LRR receptor kinase SERK2-like isoform X2 n=1 Tax=Nymphaea colorata TaxID=210225 RepID=UPI00129E5665|nr:LRR receptor kinase SERK2-like isoform X2 [Nymphaea colorata]